MRERSVYVPKFIPAFSSPMIFPAFSVAQKSRHSYWADIQKLESVNAIVTPFIVNATSNRIVGRRAFALLVLF